MSEYSQVVTTTDSEDKADTLARGIVAARLGACVQIDRIRSVYRWEGDIQVEGEWRLTTKTTTDRVPALTEHIKANHSYDVPEIVVTSITDGSPKYLSWVSEQTTQAD
ncbi:MAG: divalent-cation tolerance protein CutA [Kutzneria sp.]|nr:divalent-cation tolerance protein CutA [Kutzneria sp.]